MDTLIKDNAAVILVVEDDSVNLGDYAEKGFYQYKNFNVYNRYANTNSVKDMVEDQLKKMKEQSGQRYFLLSWTLTQNSTEATTCFLGAASSIKELATEANQRLPKMLYPEISSASFPNIIYTDDIVNSNAAAMAMAANWKLLVD